MKRIAAVIVLSLMAASLGGCEYLFGRSWVIREKLTVTVETPAGERIGSSVTEWHIRNSPGYAYSLGGIGKRQKGEAVVIEVSTGKYLFALLGKPHPLLGLIQPKEIGWSAEDELDRFSAETGFSGPVREEEYPLLVTFDNLAWPGSVTEVKPYDLATAFGPGVKLKSLTLETTDEPVTKGQIEKLLPWLPDFYDRQLDGQRYETVKSSNRFANSLTSGFFKTERKR